MPTATPTSPTKQAPPADHLNLFDLVRADHELADAWEQSNEEADRIALVAGWGIAICHPGDNDWDFRDTVTEGKGKNKTTTTTFDLDGYLASLHAARCTPTILVRHVDGDERGHMVYRGACLGCGWVSDVDRWLGEGGENAAVEDALDHTHPGFRDLPCVPPSPEGAKAEDRAAKMRDEWAPSHPDGWVASAGPTWTWRTGCGTRHVPGRGLYGGYDLGRPWTGEGQPPKPSPTADAGSGQWWHGLTRRKSCSSCKGRWSKTYGMPVDCTHWPEGWFDRSADPDQQEPSVTSTSLMTSSPRDIAIANLTVAGNLRGELDPGTLEGLTASIKAQGVLYPLIVTDLGDGTFAVKDGTRRLAASDRAGLKVVPCLLRPYDACEALLVMLAGNGLREEFSPLEEASGFVELSTVHKMRQVDIAKAVGRSQGYVSRRMKLDSLPDMIKMALRTGGLAAEAATHLADLNGHDARQDAAWRKGADGSSGTIEFHVKRELAEIERTARVDAATADLEAQNVAVVEYRSGNWLGREQRPIAGQDAFHDRPVLEVDLEWHATQRCHGAAVDREARVLWVCLDPDAHCSVAWCEDMGEHTHYSPGPAVDPATGTPAEASPAAPSPEQGALKLEVDPATRAAMESLEAAQAAWNAANEARHQAIIRIVAAKPATAAVTGYLCTHALFGWSFGEVAYPDLIDTLGPEVGTGSGDDLATFVNESGANLMRAALAMTMIRVECDLANTEGVTELGRRHYDFLVEHGYELAPCERLLLYGEIVDSEVA